MSDVVSNEPIPAPPARGRRWRRIGAAGAVGLGLALGAVGISAAASPSPSPGSSTVRPQQGYGQGPGGLGEHMRGMRGMGPGRMGDDMGLRGAVRGDVVVPNGNGGWTTVRMQRGTVTAKTASSITVKSADGHEETYAVPAGTLVNAARDGLGSIAVGDEVGVLAKVSGGSATATRIRDLTKLGADRPKGPRPRGPQQGQPNGTPASPSSYRS